MTSSWSKFEILRKRPKERAVNQEKAIEQAATNRMKEESWAEEVLMGQITMFSLIDCNHCERVRSEFNSRDVPYKEIYLTHYPFKRLDMLSLSDRLTVPQTFIGNTHVGGADDTLALLQRLDKAGPEHYEKLRNFTNADCDELDDRLEIPNEKPSTLSTAPSRNESDNAVLLPDGKTSESVFELTCSLMKTLPRANHARGVRLHKDCFLGSDGVTALMDHYKLHDREVAVQFGIRLQQAQILQCVRNYSEFSDDDQFFRLQPFHQPNVLNSFRVWAERIDPDPMALLDRLKKQFGKIESKFTDVAGRVDYLAVESDSDYTVFQEALCELQGVGMADMDETTRLVFSINAYNLMVKHAFVKVGVASSSLSRSSFYANVCYNIGGDFLSCIHLEHGIIRANSRPPYKLRPPFRKDDARYRLALSSLDPRIHFALNCGAKSCPPVSHFTVIGWDEELRIVAQAFCEEDCNVSMDEEKNELHLSMLFKWYRGDYAESTSKLPVRVLKYLRGERKATLRRMVEESEKSIKIRFKPYDWNATALRSKKFGNSKINPDEVTIRALYHGFSCKAVNAITNCRPVHSEGASKSGNA